MLQCNLNCDKAEFECTEMGGNCWCLHPCMNMSFQWKGNEYKNIVWQNNMKVFKDTICGNCWMHTDLIIQFVAMKCII